MQGGVPAIGPLPSQIILPAPQAPAADPLGRALSNYRDLDRCVCVYAGVFVCCFVFVYCVCVYVYVYVCLYLCVIFNCLYICFFHFALCLQF